MFSFRFLLLFYLACEQFFERIKAEIQPGRTTGHPVLRLLQSRGAKADQVNSTLATAVDEPSFFEHPKMTGDRWRGDMKRFGYGGDRPLSAHR
jgi:hypothetical protein